MKRGRNNKQYARLYMRLRYAKQIYHPEKLKTPYKPLNLNAVKPAIPLFI